MVVRAPDLGGCLGVDCLGPGLLRNGRVSQEPHLLCREHADTPRPSDLVGKAEAVATRLRDEISDGRHEAVGRGPTPRETQEAAERRWVAEQSAEKERGE